MNYLFTTGYEGQTINQFLVKLLDKKITTLIDIREHPFSRKPGFSKKILSERLNGIGIGYQHFKELGTPKPLRSYLASTSNYEQFFSLYKEYVREFSESIDDLGDLSENKNICILCFEKNHSFCHRKVIADILEEKYGKDVSIAHI